MGYYINFSKFDVERRKFSMNEMLRKKCKELKAFQDIPYTEIAAYLEIKKNSFYNWLKGYYNLSEEKQRKLQDIITCLEV